MDFRPVDAEEEDVVVVVAVVVSELRCEFAVAVVCPLEQEVASSIFSNVGGSLGRSDGLNSSVFPDRAFGSHSHM